ncbi:tryptophan transporter [Proteiniclasticum sp. QWL-01]|uniref:tryptophan transporter n=1 Tax=Proteiniclasticum sp. QWL-01 TaxID=3036945 RepID=UPI0024118D4B|nr:tryptophan transporter [Proteiniclasticum sp. QWL-01]WFF73151.1 tryptophan transporter [Proteiniclasticum sp. QWL-01]
MNTKKLVTAALLLAMGYLLHMMMPGLPLGNMKPDPFLAMMFLALMQMEDLKSACLIGLAAGLLTALTTTFPFGQIPNLVDKMITAPMVYLLLQQVRHLRPVSRLVLITPIGTLISGSIFLFNAQVFFQLPAPFSVLLIGVVVPAMISNTILAAVVGKALDRLRLPIHTLG